MNWAVNEKLIGSRQALSAISTGEDPNLIEAGYADQVRLFRQNRMPFLLY
jgi:hypothetical protein